MASPRRTSSATASRRTPGRRHFFMGSAIGILGLMSAALGSWPVGLPLLVFGGLFVGLGILVRSNGTSIPLVNTALNAAHEGRVADAERLLDDAERRWQLGYVRRVIDLQRANIAMRRGDLEAALARVEAALARPSSFLTRRQELGHLAAARAMRALLRASTGDDPGARADAKAVFALDDAPPEALARAAVAEAVAIEHAGDREALAAHLRAKRSLLFDSTAPRDRAVVRAFQRMLEAPRTSPYRKTAAPEAEPAATEASVADWVARVAPSAAPFARRGRTPSVASDEGEAPARAAEPELVRLAEAKVASRTAKHPLRARTRFAILWILLIVLFTAIWQLLEATDDRAVLDTALAPGAVGGLFTAALALLITAVAVATAKRQREERRLAVALSALARGAEGAVAEVEIMARSRSGLIAAQALLELARRAERQGDLGAALQHCDAGIEAATRTDGARVLLSSICLPELVAERAFVLAATDRTDEAAASMAALARQFPAFPFRARAELRVGLVERVRRGDLAGAGRLAAGASDELPLSLRDETLVDLARAAGSPEPIGANEHDRLRRELREDAALAAWTRAVAPSLLLAFQTSGESAADGEASRDAEAEREALAEEELRLQLKG